MSEESSAREVMDAREAADPFSDRRRKYFSVSEIKDYLGLSRSKVYQLIEGGQLPACRFGNSIRITRAGSPAGPSAVRRVRLR